MVEQQNQTRFEPKKKVLFFSLSALGTIGLLTAAYADTYFSNETPITTVVDKQHIQTNNIVQNNCKTTFSGINGFVNGSFSPPEILARNVLEDTGISASITATVQCAATSQVNSNLPSEIWLLHVDRCGKQGVDPNCVSNVYLPNQESFDRYQTGQSYRP